MQNFHTLEFKRSHVTLSSELEIIFSCPELLWTFFPFSDCWQSVCEDGHELSLLTFIPWENFESVFENFVNSSVQGNKSELKSEEVS